MASSLQVIDKSGLSLEALARRLSTLIATLRHRYLLVCFVLQCVAVYCNVCVAVCCSVLCCNVLQSLEALARRLSTCLATLCHCNLLVRNLCKRVLQCIAACCNVLQCVLQSV